MTDHVAYIAEVLAAKGESESLMWGALGLDPATYRALAEALVAAGIGVLPEAEVTEECEDGVFSAPVWLDLGQSVIDIPMPSEPRPTRYAEHVTEGEAVDE